jgi:hypothetical protein
MEGKPIKTCSLCGETDHNKRTCPQKHIEDTFVREETYITEEVIINPKKESLIQDLLDRDAYDIDEDLFLDWLHLRRPIKLKELRYTMDRGLTKNSIQLYLKLAKDIDDYY